jgi:hypothetical protein
MTRSKKQSTEAAMREIRRVSAAPVSAALAQTAFQFGAPSLNLPDDPNSAGGSHATTNTR